MTQIVVANLNKKVNNLINCEDVTKLLEKSYKNRDVQGIKNELDLKQKKLAKINKMITSLYSDYKKTELSKNMILILCIIKK